MGSGRGRTFRRYSATLAILSVTSLIFFFREHISTRNVLAADSDLVFTARASAESPETNSPTVGSLGAARVKPLENPSNSTQINVTATTASQKRRQQMKRKFLRPLNFDVTSPLAVSRGERQNRQDRLRQQALRDEMPKPVRFAHVISTFAVRNSTIEANPFHPLDQAQNVTISSMLRARNFTNLHVTQYAAVYPDEAHTLPDVGFRKVYLKRSTDTEYPFLRPHKRLPFIQDIFEAVMEDTMVNGKFQGDDQGCNEISSDSCFDYLVYGNSDIGIHETFYDKVASIIRQFRPDAISINRVGVPKRRKLNGTLRTGSDEDLDGIFKDMRDRAEDHPGWDCFIIHRSLLRNVNLGNLYLGYSGWDGVMYSLLKSARINMKMKSVAPDQRAIRYREYGSFSRRLTFHLNNDPGTEAAWIKKPPPGPNTTMIVKRDMLPAHKDCQLCWDCHFKFPEGSDEMEYPSLRYQSIVNCATAMRNAKQIAVEPMESVL